MPGTVNMSKDQLVSLIDNVRINGGNTDELEKLLAEVDSEGPARRAEPPRARRRPRADLDEEEETLLDRLSREVGYLFDGDITDGLLEEIIAYDRNHTLAEIKGECQEAGLSTSGHKKKMAARLIARTIPGANLPQTVTPQGRCYEEAWRFLIKEGEGKLVHGTVQSIDKRINHAWVETETGYIWEPETGGFMKRAYFYETAKPEVEAEYTPEEAAIMVARTKNLGPWTMEERRLFLKGGG